jgi:hypothetical protein
MHTSNLRRIAAVVGATAILALVLPTSTLAAPTPPKWGWVTVRTPDATYTPAAADRGNSSGKSVTVTHLVKGAYKVVFKGIGSSNGVAHVTSMATGARNCRITGYGKDGAREFVNVGCFSPMTTHSVDSRFSVSYLAVTSSAHVLGYLAFQDSTTGGTVSEHSFNSSGGTNSVQRYGAGNYTVRLNGLTTNGGNVQISTLSGAVSTTTAARSIGPSSLTLAIPSCAATGWEPAGQFEAGQPETIDVQCQDQVGDPIDSRFTLTFVDHAGLKGSGAAKVAYLWTNDPTAHSYSPNALYSFGKPSGTPTIKRPSTGVYRVTLASMPAYGAAQVTAYDVDLRCQLGVIGTGSPQKLEVRCFSLAGAPKDGRFTLSYEH